MSNPQTRKSSIVPKCLNTTTNASEKLFFIVPFESKSRKKLMQIMKRADPPGDKSCVYCCEDHFFDLCESRRGKKVFSPKKNPCYPELLCNVTSSYPNRIIKKLIRENKKKWTQLSGSVIEPSDQLTVPKIRFPGEDVPDENLCRTQSRTVRPKVGFDVNMQLRYIVNFKGFEQVLKYETCIDTNEECFGNGILPNDFKTFCKQAYSIIRLVSLNSTGNVEYGRFQIPSTCVCSYQRQDLFRYS